MEYKYKDQILSSLSNLWGATGLTENVAKSLHDGKHFGYMGNSTADPICNYLQKRFPELRFTVHPDAVTAQDEDYTRIEIPVPPPIVAFIQEFDQGNWPELALDGPQWQRTYTTPNNVFPNE